MANIKKKKASHYVTIDPHTNHHSVHADPPLCPCTLTTTTVTSVIFLLTFATRLKEVKYIRHAKTAWLLKLEVTSELRELVTRHSITAQET